MITWPYQVAGAVLIAIGVFAFGYSKGRTDGRVEQLQDSVRAYEKRRGIDAEVANIDRYGRCIELGGLSDDCEQLRGLDPAAKIEQSGPSGR